MCQAKLSHKNAVITVTSLKHTRIFFFCNQDGTCIPVTLFHHKDLKTDGRNPLLLHVYGMTELSSPPLVLKKL